MSKNPFRTPLVTPNPTGASSSISQPTGRSPFDDPIPEIASVSDSKVAGSSSYNEPSGSAGPSGSGNGSASSAVVYDPPPVPPPKTSQSLPSQDTGPSYNPSAGSSNPMTSSSSNAPSAGPPSAATTSYAPPQGPPPGASQNETSTATLEDILTSSEPPPAYTPAANPYEGEATVEYGPRRPFQQAPPPLLVNSQGSGYQPNNSMRPPNGNTGGGWSAYPGASHRSSASASNFLQLPPPQHPLSNFRPSSAPLPANPPLPPRNGRSTGNGNQTVGPGHRRVMSDFARDFYAVGGDVSTPGSAENGRVSMPEPSSSISRQPSQRMPEPMTYSASNRRPGASDIPFAAPDGPPPAGGSSTTEGDSRPTTVPTPGRPLQNKGRVLVYPAGHECRKCNNTGYKNYDPSHPCRKCWEKYAKPYTGALAYAPWDSPADRSTSTFQRPLPNFTPPQANRPPQSQSHSSFFSPPPGAGANLNRNASFSHPPPGSQGGYGQCNRPPPPPRPPIQFTFGGPPPGATVVQPGDPRIGGRVCWRCGGDGWVSFMIFDRDRCNVCNGIGRIF